MANQTAEETRTRSDGLPLRPQRGPHQAEWEMTSWLLRHASYNEVLEFYRLFAGYNIPKNPRIASSKFRNDLLQAMLPLILRYGPKVPRDQIHLLAVEFSCSESTVREVWALFRARALERGARWAMRRSWRASRKK